MDYAEFKQATKGLTLPLAWLDLDAFEQNMRDILQRASPYPVRVVTKSIRSVDVLKRILAFSSQFQGVMCYHPAEAAWLTTQGIDDILVAYPCLQSDAIAQVCQSTKAGHRVVLMVDSLSHLELIQTKAAAEQIIQPVCLDLDMSSHFPGVYFGVRRSSIHSVEQALALYHAIQQRPNIELVGLMGYEAQIAGIGDRMPGKPLQHALIPILKKKSIKQIHARRQAVVQALKQAGAKFDFVNGGGTGSIESTLSDESVTEVAVGSGFYSPHLFDYYQHFRHQPAAGFALEVVRQPSDQYITCGGGGYIASGSAGKEKLPQPYLPAGLMLDGNEGAGEVQTPLCCKGVNTDQPKVGDAILFRHAKAGELCERFNQLHLIRKGQLEASVTTYRGSGQSFM